ncbi:MAG: hypothetical protein CBE00_12700 [Planctomycetaceae bacterium TMED240]|nr:hypothetical protein [Rhodopirellula sp.]OUX04479.1 MAG: hypothetical protein CBE00_12700 [Planctomycetaceae bacterium TMED240]
MNLAVTETFVNFLTGHIVDHRRGTFWVRNPPCKGTLQKDIGFLFAISSFNLRGRKDVVIWSVSEAGQSKPRSDLAFISCSNKSPPI